MKNKVKRVYNPVAVGINFYKEPVKETAKAGREQDREYYGDYREL